MDQIEGIKRRLNNIKNTHPNLYKLWTTYIDEKLESVHKLLIECKNILNKIENKNIPDLSQDNILVLIMLISCNNERYMT